MNSYPSLLKVIPLAMVMCCSLAVSACGFQLRTWQLDGNINRAAIVNNSGATEVAGDLRRALGQAGVEIVPSISAQQTQEDTADENLLIAPDVTVQLLDTDQQRRSISVSGDARAAEYELILGVNFSLLDINRTQLIEPRWIRIQRVYQVDRNNLVGSNEEENLLRREMRIDLVQQMLRAINQVTTNIADAP